VSRIAVAGAIAAVPVAAVAVPAFAAAPSATQIDWNNQGGPNWQQPGGHHDRDHDHGGPGQQGPGPQFPQGGFLPPTGSAG